MGSNPPALIRIKQPRAPEARFSEDTEGHTISMIVLHANWTGGALHLWGECAGDPHAPTLPGAPTPDRAAPHPFAADAESLRAAIAPVLGEARAEARPITLRLPTAHAKPLPSARLAHVTGRASHDDEDAPPLLEAWRVEALRVAPAQAWGVLAALEEAHDQADDADAAEARSVVAFGPGVAYFALAARFVRRLLSEQRFVPTLLQTPDGSLTGSWMPWLTDAATSEQTRALVQAMPPCARAVVDDADHEAWPVLENALWRLADAQVRLALAQESMIEAVEGHDASAPAVAWLTGLLGRGEDVASRSEGRTNLMRSVRQWISGLDDRGAGADWRLCLTLEEPSPDQRVPDLVAPSDDVEWRLRFHLQAVEDHETLVSAEEIWSLNSETIVVEGKRLESAQELLLAELARAARIYPPLDEALEESSPTGIDLSTKQAYEFLREVRPLLIEQGVGALEPEGWEAPGSRLGAKLLIESEAPDALEPAGSGVSSAAGTRVGLSALVDYRWQIAVGETTLTLHEFENLAAQRAPLVRVDGQWVEIRPEDVQAAVKFINENPGGQMRVADALRLAYAWDQSKTGVPILGMDAKGWVADLLDASEQTLAMLEPPEGFQGELRPYQLRGLSWLSFLNRFGLGACLADDMGLGKTIQLIALLLHEREVAAKRGERVAPTLVVAPMSVVSNWQREANRFGPALKVIVHHGVERSQGANLEQSVREADLTITTYALAHRDREMLGRIDWGRVVLDEAQNVKNPSAKQSQAVRSLRAGHRVALTGTPVENRLSELWSIIDFCNPGHLGTSGDFRRRFAVPIERHHDKSRARQLRSLVRPFVLRRLKTDPNVTADLPPKVETREYCRLTSEQAALYESTVKRMLAQADQTEGMQRRGLVLASLIRLKQICNHPSQLLRDHADDPGAAHPERSGKCVRLLELLDEALSAGDQALVFTQFREMGKILASFLSKRFDREVLFMHGGTTQGARQAMIDRFQRADGSSPIFVLSLKAGGVGLNLTAANHVFHYDRWWNPAVENQATDRAHRIGQTRTVQVHKFVCSGTLEERIDQMIEQKMELATNIIGSGEQWLTELSTSELRELVALGPDAVGDDDAPGPADDDEHARALAAAIRDGADFDD